MNLKKIHENTPQHDDLQTPDEIGHDHLNSSLARALLY